MTGPAGRSPAGLGPRLGALLYEALLLGAMAIVAGFLFLPVVSPQAAVARALTIPPRTTRWAMFAALGAAAGLYYLWCWTGGRRTLPQKTWRLRLVDRRGEPLRWPRALTRYVAAWLGPALALSGYASLESTGHARVALAFLALAYVWAIVDRDRQFLHDRIASSRVVRDF